MKTIGYAVIFDGLVTLATSFQNNPLGALVVLLLAALGCWTAVSYFRYGSR